MTKRTLFSIVLLSLCLCVFGYSGGNGTESNPYQIATLADLEQLSNTPADWVQGKYFTQTADIDASLTQYWNDGQGFSPIGDYLDENSNRMFLGNYNGGGCTISNLFVYRPYVSKVGLFGLTMRATISNLEVENANITGYEYVGALAGDGRGIIVNCTSSGNIIGENYVGGLLGLNCSGVGTPLSDCSSCCNVTGMSNVGGLAGMNTAYSHILNCNSSGNVNSTIGHAGGLVGWNRSDINNSHSSGIVSCAGDDVGGLVGYNDCISSISNCYSNCDVTGSQRVGGLIGSQLSTTVVDCFSTGTVTALFTSAGGLVAVSSEVSSIIDSYSTSNVIGNGDTSAFTGGSGGFVADNVGGSSISNCYSSGSVNSSHQCVGGFVGRNSSSSINDSHSYGDVSGSGLYSGGFIGYNDYHSTVNNCFSTGSVIGISKIGGFMGVNNDSSSIIDCFSTGCATGSEGYIGGFVGINQLSSSISRCYSTGSANGTDCIGGLVGRNQASVINDCYCTGEAIGTGNCIGGLIGDVNAYTVERCYSTGLVMGGAYVGGLVGYNAFTTFNNCYWNIETSYQASSAEGEGRTTDEMTYPYASNTYTSWDFDNIWEATSSNGGYPQLRNMPDVDIEDDIIPTTQFYNIKNFPNPFHQNTSICYTLPKAEVSELVIYNLRGQLIRKLVNAPQSRGEHTVTWDGKDDNGKALASGMYLCRISNAGKQETHKMLLLK